MLEMLLIEADADIINETDESTDEIRITHTVTNTLLLSIYAPHIIFGIRVSLRALTSTVVPRC